MFEKEAKEYKFKIQEEYLDLGKNGAFPPLWERIDELWRNGAEFGYKAKEERIAKLEKVIASLLAQIDKMKNCGNCNGMSKGSGLRTAKCKLCIQNAKLSEWELAEN